MHKVVICGLDTSKLPKITAKECDELLLKVRNGDSDAKEVEFETGTFGSTAVQRKR